MSIVKILLIPLFCFVSLVSFADPPDLLEQLNQLQQQRTVERKQLEQEKQDISTEILRLQQRAAEIEQRASALETQVSLDFRADELDELLGKSFAPCQVVADAHPMVYFVSKGEVEIQLSFHEALDDVIGQISKKSVGLDQQDVIEINIVPRYPEAHPASRTSALVRLNPDTMEVVHATFTGLRVNDRMFGWSDSLNLYQMVCNL